MNKLIITLITCFSLSVLIIGCTSEMDKEENELNNNIEIPIENNKVLKIGAINFPPYYYFENGEFTGPTAEVIVEAFNRMGVEIEINQYPWARLLKSAEIGEIDIIVDVFITNKRLSYLKYSSKKLITHYNALFKLKTTEIKFNGDFTQINEYTIGYVKNYNYGKAFDRAVNNKILTLEEATSDKQNIEKLVNGRVKLVIGYLVPMNTMIDTLGYSDQIVSIEPYVNKQNSYLAFSKINNLDIIINQYNNAIRSMLKDGTIEDIYRKYNINNY